MSVLRHSVVYALKAALKQTLSYLSQGASGRCGSSALFTKLHVNESPHSKLRGFSPQAVTPDCLKRGSSLKSVWIPDKSVREYRTLAALLYTTPQQAAAE